MVVCTDEVVGKVVGTDLQRRSMGVLDDDKMIVLRTIHRSIDEAVVVGPCQGTGTGVSKAHEDDDEGGEDDLRKGIHKRRGMKASAHGNVPYDSTSSKVSVRHYCCFHCYWSPVAQIGAAAVLYLRFAGQSTKPKTTMWTMSKTSMPRMLLGYGETDGGNGVVEEMVDDGHESSKNMLLLLSVLLVVDAANVGDAGKDSLGTGGSEPGAETHVSGEKQLVPPHQQMKMPLRYSNLHVLAVVLLV